ncbi:MAG: NTE family protein [Gammaproteobacteria bacterium]|jgi:NTE family protein
MLRLVLLLLLLTSFSAITSLELMAAEAKKQRPKIGLALSGGGARGAAHIGVIKVLEELRIPIDYIAGTSMGAVIGGLYASGMSSDEVEKQLATIDWNDVFSDKPSRPDRSQRRKSDDVLYLVKGKAGISDSGVNIPTAVVQGQKFDLILKALTLPVSNVADFDLLPIPYRAVAMDITTGEEVVLSSGDLSIAMHASMAIPGAFAPVKLGGKLLVDGGAANNLPISVVREMGADIVIAIDISTPLLKQEELGGALAVIDQLTGILTRRNTEAQIKTLSDDDILIVPNLGDIATMDFEQVADAVEVGRLSGKMAAQQLASLSVNDQAYQEHQIAQARGESHSSVIEFVHFKNDSSLSELVLKKNLAIEPGQVFDLDKIEKGIENIYGLDIFESVRYDIVEEGGETGLAVYVKQKSWGTDSVQTGLELSSDFTGQSSFNLGFAYTKQPFNELNGEWRTALQLGEEPGIFTEIYQPLDPAAKYFAAAGVSWENKNIRLFSDANGRADAEYEVARWGLRFAVGRNIGKWGEVRVGIRRFTGNADVSVGAPSFRSFDFDDGQVFARAKIDTLDNFNFPRHGSLTSVEWTAGLEDIGADNDYDQVLLLLSGARSWGDGSLISSLRFGSTVGGDASINNRYRLGGFMDLSGLEQNQLSGQHLGLMTIAYQYRVYRSQVVPVYAGGALQLGNTWEERSDISLGNALTSATLFLGADTPLGPFYLGYGYTEGGNNAAFLFLGQPFF